MRYFLVQHLHNASAILHNSLSYPATCAQISLTIYRAGEREHLSEREAASDISTLSAQIRDFVGIKCADVKLF